MRYGIEIVPFGQFADPREVVKLAQVAEAAGWEGLWIWDHVTMPWGAGDPWVTLAAVAAATAKIKLITGVAPLPRYRLHLLARTLNGLDRLSNGRLIFGTGLGVDFDYAPYGDTTDAKTHAAMLDEGLDVLAKWWAEEAVTHHGPHFNIEAVRLAPMPIQHPRIPVWIGGESKPALRRAARWDGWIMGCVDEQKNVTKTPEHVAQQVSFIHQYRTSDAPLDVMVDGVSEPGDIPLAREYADAGATWWCEIIFGSRAPMDELFARVKAGPPR